MNDREIEIQAELKLKNEREKQAIQTVKDKHMTELAERTSIEKSLKDMAVLMETQNKVYFYVYMYIFVCMYVCMYLWVYMCIYVCR
jgi:predicted neutral ceramidase superfamily lipid hydrolase